MVQAWLLGARRAVRMPHLSCWYASSSGTDTIVGATACHSEWRNTWGRGRRISSRSH